MTRRLTLPAGLAGLALLGGCGDPPRMVNMAPPGLQKDDDIPEDLKGRTSAALGESGLATARRVEDRLKPITPLEATEPGVEKTLDSGLKYTTIKVAPPNTPVAEPGGRVTIHYTGKLVADGSEFETSRGKRPFSFTLGLGTAIDGWDYGIAGMKVGEVRRLVIPADLGFRDQKKPGVPQDADLDYEIELIAAKPKEETIAAAIESPSYTVSEPLPPTEEGVEKELPSGLKYTTLRKGEEDGPSATSGSEVKVHYDGTLTNGNPFDSSRKRNEPFSVTLGTGGVIKGWDQGIVGMKIGELRKLVIPADLAYGRQAKGSIPPNSTLVFEVEMLEIKPPMGSPKQD
jgi:FKBP-type peptidyl-prolyl cis-trans isomerase